jgi:hypothetical protein
LRGLLRIHEEAGKLWFTIMDFKKATELFADPDFDGEPEVIYEPDSHGSPIPPDSEADSIGVGDTDADADGAVKYVVSDVEVSIIAERVQYYGKDGKLITESLRDYTKSAVQEHYASLDDFLQRWSEAERKQAIIDELRAQVSKDLDAFDLICHVVYDRPPLTRRERAEQVKKRDVFTKYSAPARAVLNALLDKYADEGLVPVEDLGVLRVQPSRISALPLSWSGPLAAEMVTSPPCVSLNGHSILQLPDRSLLPLPLGEGRGEGFLQLEENLQQCRFPPPSSPSRISCARTLVSTAMPSALVSSSGSSSSKSGTTASKSWSCWKMALSHHWWMCAGPVPRARRTRPPTCAGVSGLPTPRA